MATPGPKYPIILIVLLCIVTRVPQMVSPHFFLDGDECLVGMMAKHICEGKSFPLFFWGQQYGFTLIECLFIIPFYLLLGISTLAVKLGALSLWTLGVVFLYKALQQLNKKSSWVPFVLIILFICLPAWAIWSMKARGGYLTAFTLSNAVLWMLFDKKYSSRVIQFFAIGVLLNFIYQSQAFWLVGIVPVVMYRLWEERKWLNVLAIIVGVFPLVALFYLYKKQLVTTYVPPTIIPDYPTAKAYIKRIPEFLYVSLHGNYYFSFYQSPNFFCALLAIITSFTLGIISALGAFFVFFRRKHNGLYIISVLFIPGCLAYALFSPDIQGRYLLPLTGFMLIPLQLLLNKVLHERPFMLVSGILSLAGMIAVATFWNFDFLKDRKPVVLGIVDYAKRHNVKYSYCTDCMVPWQVVFYSKEEHLSRMPFVPDRYPPNAAKIDKALYTGKKVMVICYKDQLQDYDVDSSQIIYDFAVGLNPTKLDLTQHFYFENETTQ